RANLAPVLMVTNANDSGPGSLREAIGLGNVSVPPSVIVVNATGTVALASSLPDITNSLDVIGPGPAFFKISGQGNTQIIRILGAGYAVGFSGLTFARGNTSSGGGAVLSQASDATSVLTFFDCVFEKNRSGQGNGGAISVTGPVDAGVV